MTMLQKLNAKIGGVYYGWWNAVASMVCLMLIFGVPTVLLPFVYGPVIDEFAKHCFGPTQLGKLIGILTAVASAGYAVGPWAVGWMYDQHGTYRYAFASLIGLSIVSATLLTWVQPTYRNQLVPRSVEVS